MKNIIITGITGQAGSILADKLIDDNKIYGLVRRSSRGPRDLYNAQHLLDHPNLTIIEGDITDLTSMMKLTNEAKADWFFHCAAQSHVGVSFSQPTLTANITGIGTLNCLEAIRLSSVHTRFMNCATSELFGGLTGKPANEETPFHPRSPYGVAKLAGYWYTVNYRETYKMFASNAIMFNYESERRGPDFVTRKITIAVANIKAGKQDYLYLGNLDAKRDWSYAGDTMDGCIKMLQHNEPDDFVFSTGETHSVREFCEEAFKYAGLGDYQQYVKIDPKFYRPCEVDVLIGDASKAHNVLNWKPKTSFKELVHKMVDYDMGFVAK